MKRIRKLRGTPFLALALVAWVCDQAHAPVIHNTLDQPIVLSVQYGSGLYDSGEIPPDAMVWAPADGVAVDLIEVRMEGKVLFRLEKQELERLRSSLPPGTRVMWEIHENGVTATVAPE